ncbi:MAG TPA: TIGR02300 family protein [Devosia sp.]
MASSERGTKRIDPDNGKKFYDLNMDPIVSPYTGKSYPRSYFEQVLAGKPSPALARKVDDEDEEEVEEEVEDVAAPEIVSLEDADAEEAGDEEIPDVEDVEVDEELVDDEEDVFLEEDEDEDDELGFDVGGDEDR